MQWRGAKLINISDGDMVDAMGGFETGAFMEYVPVSSKAYGMGFRTADIITELNGQPVHTIEQLERTVERTKRTAKNKNKPGMTFKVIRGYQEILIYSTSNKK